MKHLLPCLLLLCPLAAAAQSPSPPTAVSECERIKNDLAYNQCLASFGPKRGERAAVPAAQEDRSPAAARRASRGGRTARRGRGGRQAAAFDVVSGPRRAARSARAAPSRKARGSRKRR